MTTQLKLNKKSKKKIIVNRPKKKGWPRKFTRAQRARKLKALNFKGLPVLRDIRLEDPEDMRREFAVFWAAYIRGSFQYFGENLSKEEFVEKMVIDLAKFQSATIAEDYNELAGGGMAPICISTEFFDGWQLKPHVEWFPWATERNKLRCAVNYFKMLKSREDAGVVIVEALKEASHFFNRVSEYGFLFPVARVKHGLPEGDMYQYSVTCQGAFNVEKV